MAKWKVKVFAILSMVGNTKDNLKIIKKKEEESYIGRMMGWTMQK